MLPPGDYIFSAICLTILIGIFNIRAATAFFMSIGMLMIFFAWLQWINFDGSWPSNQPRMNDYKISKAKLDKLDDLIYTKGKLDDLTSTDWEDYRRCKNLNVCVRRFKSLAEPR